MEGAVTERRIILTSVASLGVAIGVGALIWNLSLDTFADCGTPEEVEAFDFSLFFVFFGPYLGCIAFPVLWRRPPEKRIAANFLIGFAVSVFTGFASSSSTGSGDFVVFLFPLLGLVAVWKWGTVPGRIGGYVLGAATVPTALVFLFTAVIDTCS